jgi:hypothetical protein
MHSASAEILVILKQSPSSYLRVKLSCSETLLIWVYIYLLHSAKAEFLVFLKPSPSSYLRVKLSCSETLLILVYVNLLHSASAEFLEILKQSPSLYLSQAFLQRDASDFGIHLSAALRKSGIPRIFEA